MKKTIIAILTMVLLCSVVLAQDKGIHTPGTGLDQNITPEEREAVQIGQQITEQLRYELRKQTPEGVRQLVQERRQLMEQELSNITNRARQIAYQNQNEVRLAVHAFLEMENITGEIGPQIREIARNFNNSVQATIRAEERIATRSRIARFFSGGDAESAEELEREVNQNQLKIQELKRLRDECDCSAEVKAMMQEQIQSMEQEQTRLQELAQAEKKSKGLFGWLWK